MATFVSDTFTAANGTNITSRSGEVGATWTSNAPSAGTFLIQSNRAYPSVVGNVYASGTPATAEYTVECDYYIASATGSSGPAGRIAPGANTYYYAYHNSPTNEWLLVKNVTGTLTTLGVWVSAVTTGQTYVVKLELLNAAKKVYINGVERISSADNGITAAGRAGMRSGSANTSTTGRHMTNFLAYDGTTPGPPPHFFHASVT